MANAITDLIQSFELYYTDGSEQSRYPQSVLQEITRRFNYFPQYFIQYVFDQVIGFHSKNFGLPDVSVITKAIDKLERPEAYRPAGWYEPPIPPPDQKQIEGDTPEDIDRRKGRESMNAAGREAVRKKAAGMTIYEQRWLYCVEELNGDWAMLHRKFPHDDWTTEKYLELIAGQDEW